MYSVVHVLMSNELLVFMFAHSHRHSPKFQSSWKLSSLSPNNGLRSPLSLSLSLSTKNENGHPSIRGPQRPSEKRPRRLARFLLSKFRAKVCPTILKQHHNLILHLIWNCDITDIFCASHGSPLILCYEPFDKGCPKFTRTELHIARGEGRESREQ